MPEFLITSEHLHSGAQPDLTTSPGGAAPAPRRGEHMLTGRWLGDDGQTELGEEFEIPAPDAARVEAFAQSGVIEHVEIETGLAFSAEPPADARDVRVFDGGRLLAQFALAAVQAPPPMPLVEPERFGPEAASFVYPVFSERFATQQSFREAVQSLYDWIIGVPPFNRQPVRARFAIDAYFWPANHPHGHFNTRDIMYNCAQPPANAVVFMGDNGIARARLRTLLLDGRHGLILINSSVRGGAGGMPSHGCPAWASITSCPGESWQAVALHEVAHGLGLADEYQDAGRASEASAGEPNIARSSDFEGVGWAAMLTEHPVTANSFYSLERQDMIRAGRTPAPPEDFVGLFQGARYRPDLFRPSWQCLMHSTAITRFCPVCARSIEQRVAV